MAFTIYDAPTAGNALWTEIDSVPVDDGFYSVVLGDTAAIPPTVFTGPERYLEIAVAGSTLSPRQRIDSVAYSLLSQGIAGATSCSSGQVPKWNGSGWACGDDIDSNSGGTVTSVSGTTPIAVANRTTTPTISISQSGTSANGYLSSADWNTFNNKQNRIVGACGGGQYIQGINVDGTVNCGTDANTSYTAG
jgi:hypothetical protein